MNSVDIIGMLREKVDNQFRFFEYELPFLEEANNAPTTIIVRFWTDQLNSRLLVLEPNTRVALHGHLDGHEKFGTILVVEQFQVLR